MWLRYHPQGPQTLELSAVLRCVESLISNQFTAPAARTGLFRPTTTLHPSTSTVGAPCSQDIHLLTEQGEFYDF